MADLVPFSDILGAWLSIFLSFAILSFLYKDNPFYKFAEHLFIGISIGYLVAKQYYDVIEPKVVDRLFGGEAAAWMRVCALIAIALFAMMLVKSMSRRWAWLGRYPIAYVVALFASLEVVGLVESDLGAQIRGSMVDLDAVSEKVNINEAPRQDLMALPGVTAPIADAIVDQRAHQPIRDLDELARLPGLDAPERAELRRARGHLTGLDARASVSDHGRNWFGLFSQLLLIGGLLASLIYFYFSIEQKGPVGRISRAGVWILMIGFGASFGYTVQGRLALAIGRGIDIMGMDKEAGLAARIHGKGIALASIAVIVIGLLIWERRGKRT